MTKRVVGVDLNPDYIGVLLNRFGSRLPGLETYVQDVQDPSFGFAPVDFVYAALVFEYVSPARALSQLRTVCRPGGTLAALIQLPCESMAPVSPSPFESLQALVGEMQLVSPIELADMATHAGFALQSSQQIELPSGKGFALQVFRR